jgi:activating signal cointegrator complex subunit 3
MAPPANLNPPWCTLADDPHTKASLLLQAHLGRLPLPLADYLTDTRSVLDNSLRVLQAVVDLAADAGWLASALSAMSLAQGLMQGRWHDAPAVLALPHVTPAAAAALDAAGLGELRALAAAHHAQRARAAAAVEAAVGARDAREVAAVLARLPLVQVRATAARARRAPPAPKPAPAAPPAPADGEPGPEIAEPPHEEPSEDEAAEPGWQVEVELVRAAGRGAHGGGPPRAYAPHFPKVKDEGWWVVAADEAAGELLALKRVSFGQRATVRLAVPARGAGGGALAGVDVLLVSDSYLGLDQRARVELPL